MYGERGRGGGGKSVDDAGSDTGTDTGTGTGTDTGSDAGLFAFGMGDVGGFNSGYCSRNKRIVIDIEVSCKMQVHPLC